MMMSDDPKPDPMADPQTHLDTDPVNAPDEPEVETEDDA